MGNVGRIQKLIAAKRQRLSIAHLNIVSAFQLLSCYRWSMEPSDSIATAITVVVPFALYQKLHGCRWSMEPFGSVTAGTRIVVRSVVRRSFVPSQPPKTALSQLVDGTLRSFIRATRRNVWHIFCTLAQNMPSSK